MKYIIHESQAKNLIKKYFKKDLSKNIRMITSFDDLPRGFREIMGKNAGNYFLNSFGPMFLFTINGEKYLAQDRIEKWVITDDGDSLISDDKLMNLLGIDTLGLTMQELIDAYIEE
jgi:hypothetical protein